MISKTKEEFYALPIRRTGEIAEIIYDQFEGHDIRLIGFVAESNQSDTDIYDLGWEYYQDFVAAIWGEKLKESNN